MYCVLTYQLKNILNRPPTFSLNISFLIHFKVNSRLNYFPTSRLGGKYSETMVQCEAVKLKKHSFTFIHVTPMIVYTQIFHIHFLGHNYVGMAIFWNYKNSIIFFIYLGLSEVRNSNFLLLHNL